MDRTSTAVITPSTLAWRSKYKPPVSSHDHHVKAVSDDFFLDWPLQLAVEIGRTDVAKSPVLRMANSPASGRLSVPHHTSGIPPTSPPTAPKGLLSGSLHRLICKGHSICVKWNSCLIRISLYWKYDHILLPSSIHHLFVYFTISGPIPSPKSSYIIIHSSIPLLLLFTQVISRISFDNFFYIS